MLDCSNGLIESGMTSKAWLAYEIVGCGCSFRGLEARKWQMDNEASSLRRPTPPSRDLAILLQERYILARFVVNSAILLTVVPVENSSSLLVV